MLRSLLSLLFNSSFLDCLAKWFAFVGLPYWISKAEQVFLTSKPTIKITTLFYFLS